MASSLLVNPFTKNNGEPASSSLYRFSVHCLYQDFVKSCVFFYFFHQRIEVFHDLLPLSCRSYEIFPASHFQRISCRSCPYTECKSSATPPVINRIGTRYIIKQRAFYFRNLIKFAAFFRRSHAGIPHKGATSAAYRRSFRQSISATEIKQIR